MAIKFKYQAGDSIQGKSIIGEAGTIFHKRTYSKNSVTLKALEFFKSAVCYLNVPITMEKTNTVCIDVEGLKGKKIYGEAEDYSKITKVKHTHGHTQQQTVLKNNAYCVVSIPITSQQ